MLGTGSQCIATHPSDMAVAMRLLDASVETVAPNGAKRVIPIADLQRLPDATPHIEPTLQAGKMITAVTLLPPLPGRHICRKVRDRASYAFALVSVAAVVDAPNGRVKSARLAFDGLAHKPWRVATAEAGLAGASLGGASARQAAEKAADSVLAGARGFGHNDFKIPLLRCTLRAVLTKT